MASELPAAPQDDATLESDVHEADDYYNWRVMLDYAYLLNDLTPFERQRRFREADYWRGWTPRGLRCPKCGSPAWELWNDRRMKAGRCTEETCHYKWEWKA